MQKVQYFFFFEVENLLTYGFRICINSGLSVWIPRAEALPCLSDDAINICIIVKICPKQTFSSF